MYKTARVLTLAAIGALLLPAGAAAQRITMTGFSVEKPAGRAWVRLRAKGNMVIFRRRAPGTATTVIAFGRTLQGRANGWSGLEAQAHRLTSTTDGSRALRRNMGNARCVFKRFQRPAKSKTGQQYLMKGADFYCLHPQTGQTVHLGVSQRHSLSQSVINIDNDIGRFMNSLQFH
jgi:hypothetical protein